MGTASKVELAKPWCRVSNKFFIKDSFFFFVFISYPLVVNNNTWWIKINLKISTISRVLSMTLCASD
jgi:hypothetical protein